MRVQQTLFGLTLLLFAAQVGAANEPLWQFDAQGLPLRHSSLLPQAARAPVRIEHPAARIPQSRMRLAASPPVTDDHPFYHFTDVLSTQLAPRLNPSGKVKRVFYPMGASDLPTALAMFDGPAGGPTDILITDLLSFGTPREVQLIHENPERKAMYVGRAGGSGYDPRLAVRDGSFIDIAAFFRKTRITGPALLWELERLGASGVVVHYLDEEGKAARPPTRPRAVSARPSWSNPSVAAVDVSDRDIVRVSFVLNGVKRRLTYVQQDVFDHASVPPVLARFLDRGIDAYVEKAPYGVTRDQRYTPFRDRGLARLDARHGVLVSDHEDSIEALSKMVPGRHAFTTMTGFGYGPARVSAPIASGIR